MGMNAVKLGNRRGMLALALLPCLVLVPALADETPGATVGADEPFSVSAGDAMNAPFPLRPDHASGFDFDLGGSETRKLQLQLDRPLSLQTETRARLLDSGTSLLGLDATLNAPLSDSFNLSAGVERRLGATQFQSLGSIQCHNGTLRADSYTASGCRFVNEPIAGTDQRRIDLGARFDFANASASIDWFTQEADFTATPAFPVNRPAAPLVLDNTLLSPGLGNPLIAGASTDPMQYLNSEATGVDLNFKVGIATSNSGDIQLGLAFGRILEAEYRGLYGNGVEALSWTVAEPFNTARMGIEWSRGSFSGGVQGFYREPVDFLDRNSLDSLTTFDVHFTWRTPWNADLSVGASNVLDAGSEAGANVDSPPVDPLESIYGRIPYVRYKQDL
jgi:hypothetical protein